jgi:hypothetical protein
MSPSTGSVERPKPGTRGDTPDAGPAPATLSRPAPATPSRLYRSVWLMHRAYHRLTRRGLSRPTPDRWGMLSLGRSVD